MNALDVSNELDRCLSEDMTENEIRKVILRILWDMYDKISSDFMTGRITKNIMDVDLMFAPLLGWFERNIKE
jgi:hypothetical protein